MQPIKDTNQYFRPLDTNSCCHSFWLSNTVLCYFNELTYWAKFYYQPRHSGDIYFIDEFIPEPELFQWEEDGETFDEWDLPKMTEQRAREYYDAHIKVG